MRGLGFRVWVKELKDLRNLREDLWTFVILRFEARGFRGGGVVVVAAAVLGSAVVAATTL